MGLLEHMRRFEIKEVMRKLKPHGGLGGGGKEEGGGGREFHAKAYQYCL